MKTPEQIAADVMEKARGGLLASVTPGRTEQLIAAAIREAVEEAARVADHHAGKGTVLAEAIRALALPATTGEG